MKSMLSWVLAAAVAASAIAVHAQGAHGAQRLLKAAINTELVDGNLKAAIEQYKKVAAGSDRALAAQALLRMADCYEKLGDAQARQIYERVVREYADQREFATLARSRLEAPAINATQTAKRVAVLHDIDYPAVSPDGRWLTFRSSQSLELIARDLASNTERALTNARPDAQAGPSATSLDAGEIAYAWREGAGFTTSSEVRVVSLGDRPAAPRVVHRSTGEESDVDPISWMPDRSRMLVVRRFKDRTDQLAIMSTQDGSIRVLKSLAWWYPNASLSPDGRYVAYDVPGPEGSRRDIVLLATDGSRETPLVQGPADDFEPLWTADGSSVVFRSDRTGVRALWRMPVGGGHPSGAPQLVKSEFGARLLAVTKRGVLYSMAWNGGRNVYAADLESDVAGPRIPERLGERSINSNFGPAWSPDGQWLAYYSSRSPTQSVLVLRSAKTREEREIPLDVAVTTGASFKPAPIWFPDGRALLIVGGTQQRQGGKGYYRLDLQTGRVDLLVHPRAFGVAIFRPAIAPDGRSLFYPELGNTPPTRSIVQYDLETRQEKEVAQAPAGFFFTTVALSPDGRQLASLLAADSGPAVAIQVTPSTGGASREIVRTTSARASAPLMWSPDQRSLLFVGGDGEGTRAREHVWRVPVAGGPAEKTTLVFDMMLSFSLHPDRRHVAFDVSEPSSAELWTLDRIVVPEIAAARSSRREQVVPHSPGR